MSLFVIVAAHRDGRSGDDHGAPVRRHSEELLVLAVGRQRGHDELGEPGADGQLEPRRRRGRRARVRHEQAAERPLPRDHAGRLQLDAHAVVHAAEHEPDRHEHRGEQREPEERELDPAERPGDDERHRRGGEHEPSGGRHDAGHRRREPGEGAAGRRRVCRERAGGCRGRARDGARRDPRLRGRPRRGGRLGSRRAAHAAR